MKTRASGRLRNVAVSTAITALLVGGCVTAMRGQQAADRAPSSVPDAARNDRYLSRIQPIFDNRCVVCHACVDAPCQLQLTSFGGAQRGATQLPPLVGTRLAALPPTRLKDAASLAEWRAKGDRQFFPVIPEGGRSDGPRSLLLRMIERGPAVDPKRAPSSLRESPSCAKDPSAIAEHVGMPYGLPPLTDGELDTLTQWVRDGAPGPSDEAMRSLSSPTHPATISAWESFLNQGTVKSQIVSRFIYEHAFTAHIHFEGDPANEFYELIRSGEAPQGGKGGPVPELVTARPYDAPSPKGVRVFYRLRRITDAIVQKTHIVWELDSAKLARFNELFFGRPWPVDRPVNPGYGQTNPFRAFAQIPAEGRSRFMIENSKLIIEAMIRGPVCTGRTATYAIRDHFYIFFLDPKSDVSVADAHLADRDWPAMDSKHVIRHMKYRAQQNDALKAFFKARGTKGFQASDIWNGDGDNRNAILTVLRHETNASVHHGPIGGRPKTSWVLSFSNFERLYYNLVVDFMPWGSLTHRMSTWTFMSFLRSEAEERFLQFLPVDEREDLRGQWNRGYGAVANLMQAVRDDGLEAGVTVDPEKPMASLLSRFRRQMSPQVLGAEDPYNFHVEDVYIPGEPVRTPQDWNEALAQLASRKDLHFARFLPNLSTVMVYDGEKTPWVHTLVANRGYKYNNNFALESMARVPEEDTMAVFPGVVGSYPEQIFILERSNARRFQEDLHKVKSLDAWKAFKSKYALRRWDPRFWSVFDALDAVNRDKAGLEAGILDLSHYDLTDEAY